MELIVISCSLCSIFIFPTTFLFGVNSPFLLALLLLHFSNYFPVWSKQPFPACFAPTSFFLLLPRLEQTSLSCSLCSNLIFPTSSPIGASHPSLLALLHLHFSNYFPVWSKQPFPACFAPISFFLLLPRLEQAPLSCSLCSNFISPSTP